MSYDDFYSGQGQDEDLMFLMQLFGSPQFEDGANQGMPGDTFSSRMANLKNIEYITGIPITQLMGGGSTGEAGEMPQMDTSYTAQVYGSNPMYADAFKAIDSGVDPQTVYQEMLNKRKEYGIAFDDGSPEYQDWADRTYGVLNDYAFENTKAKSEYEKAMSEYEGNAGNTFTIGSKKYQGSPDINGMASQAQLLGLGSEQDLIRSVADQRQQQRMAGASQADRQGYQTAQSLKGSKSMAPLTDLGVRRAQMAEKNIDGSFNPFQKYFDQKLLAPAYQRAQNTMVRSDANSEAMRKIMALRAIMGV